MDKTPLEIKIVLLGDAGVGKSSILLRYVTDSFKTDAEGTVGASYMGKILNINDRLVKLNIWDTAGQERYHSLAKMYYRDANAALLVYDVTNQDSFEGMVRWYNEVKQNTSSNIVVAIAANKEDLIEKEKITQDQASKFAESINAIFKRTSAKNSYGIDQIFKDIVVAIFPEVNQVQDRSSSVHLSTKKVVTQKKNCC